MYIVCMYPCACVPHTFFFLFLFFFFFFSFHYISTCCVREPARPIQGQKFLFFFSLFILSLFIYIYIYNIYIYKYLYIYIRLSNTSFSFFYISFHFRFASFFFTIFCYFLNLLFKHKETVESWPRRRNCDRFFFFLRPFNYYYFLL